MGRNTSVKVRAAILPVSRSTPDPPKWRDARPLARGISGGLRVTRVGEALYFYIFYGRVGDGAVV